MHAFLCTLGRPLPDLGTLGGPTSCAASINEKGQLVGESDLSDGLRHAFYYDSTAGMQTSARSADAIARPPPSMIAARSLAAPRRRWRTARATALLYSSGKMLDLNSVVDSAAGLVLVSANGINDPGQIVGGGSPGTERCERFS